MNAKEAHHILREASASAGVAAPSAEALDDFASVALLLPPETAKLIAADCARGMSNRIDYAKRQRELN